MRTIRPKESQVSGHPTASQRTIDAESSRKKRSALGVMVPNRPDSGEKTRNRIAHTDTINTPALADVHAVGI